MKCLSLGVNWFVFCPQSYLVLLSSGTIGNQMQTLHVTPGNLHKLTKFEGKKRFYDQDQYAGEYFINIIQILIILIIY